MARYADFLGRRVEVHYRAGDIVLHASGVFAADSGRSIFLEEHIGPAKHFRWEIPYQCIIRIAEKLESVVSPEPPSPQLAQPAARKSAPASADAPLLPLQNRPKEA